jgi:SAM-dependent methyltransferase
MNLFHRWLCRSAGWGRAVEERIVPWVLDGVELGADVLEVGPGPGLTTALLRARTEHLTALEVDDALATALAARLLSTNVTVRHGDGAAMPFADASFSAVVCFTMLHHVPSAARQDALLREALRVLRPGGIFAGTDSRDGASMRVIHLFDTLVPVDPTTFDARLGAAGFEDILIEKNAHAFRFHARRPGSAAARVTPSA